MQSYFHVSHTLSDLSGISQLKSSHCHVVGSIFALSFQSSCSHAPPKPNKDQPETLFVEGSLSWQPQSIGPPFFRMDIGPVPHLFYLLSSLSLFFLPLPFAYLS